MTRLADVPLLAVEEWVTMTAWVAVGLFACALLWHIAVRLDRYAKRRRQEVFDRWGVSSIDELATLIKADWPDEWRGK